jgi:hypothetical protein
MIKLGLWIRIQGGINTHKKDKKVLQILIRISVCLMGLPLNVMYLQKG